jgi:hypothetical protein
VLGGGRWRLEYVRGMHLERTLKFPSRSVLLYDFMLVPHLAYAIPKLASTRLCRTQLPYLMRCCHPSCLFQTTPAHHKRQPSTCFRSPRYTFYLKSCRPIQATKHQPPSFSTLPSLRLRAQTFVFPHFHHWGSKTSLSGIILRG